MIVVHSSENDVTTGLLVDGVLGIRAVPNVGEPSTDPFADFVSEWRQSDMQHVAVLDLDKAIDLTRPNQRIK